MIYLDTHVTVWLYEGDTERFSSAQQNLLNHASLVASPFVLLELQYLKEIKRIREDPHAILDRLQEIMTLNVREISMSLLVHEAVRQSWTRDAFDRMITAQAVLDNAPLMTKDRIIQRHYAGAFWRNVPEYS